MTSPKKQDQQQDEFYPDARERGDRVLRRLLKTKPDPKWKPAVKRKAKQGGQKG